MKRNRKQTKIDPVISTGAQRNGEPKLYEDKIFENAIKSKSKDFSTAVEMTMNYKKSLAHFHEQGSVF